MMRLVVVADNKTKQSVASLPWTALSQQNLCMASPLLHKFSRNKAATVCGVMFSAKSGYSYIVEKV